MLLIEFHISLRPVRTQGHVTIYCIPRLPTLVFRDVRRGIKKSQQTPGPAPAVVIRARAHVGGRKSGRIVNQLTVAIKWKKKSPCGCSLRFFSHQKISGSRPVILPCCFANFNCYNSKTSKYFYYKIVIFSFQSFKPFLLVQIRGPTQGHINIIKHNSYS